MRTLRHNVETEFAVLVFGDSGAQEMLLAYGLVLKYDCANLVHHLVHGFATLFRILRENSNAEMRTFVENHIDFVISHNDGRYPVDLAPAIAEAWSYVAEWGMLGDYESKIVAVIESEPSLAVAVARYYKDKLDHAEGSTARFQNAFQGPNFD